MSLAFAGPAEAAVDRQLTRLAKCWQLTRSDGTIYRFTEHNAKLTVDGNEYTPVEGIDDSAVRKEVGFDKDQNVEFRGAITTSAITAADLRSGRFRGSRLTEFLVDWAFAFPGAMRQRKWIVRDVTFDGENWFAQCTGLTGLLRQRIGRIFQRWCDFDLGDGDCGFSLPTRTLNMIDVATVDSTEPRRKFTATIGAGQIPGSIDGKTIADGFFDFGKITWLSGSANAGFVSEVKRYTEVATVATFELQLETPFDILTTDLFDVSQGCAKTMAVCDTDFDQSLQHGGQNLTPGGDRLSRRGANG